MKPPEDVAGNPASEQRAETASEPHPPAAGKEVTRHRPKGAAWTLLAIAGLSVVQAARQDHGDHEITSWLSGLWWALAVVAVTAAVGAWQRARWARFAVGVWLLDALVTTAVGTALMYGGRPPRAAVLPGVVVVGLIGWAVARGVWRGTAGDLPPEGARPARRPGLSA
jgi:cation transport ATPase